MSRPSVRVVTDSTCDLPAELLRQHHITVLPMHVCVGDRCLLDGLQVTPQDIFDYVALGGDLPSTSAVNAAAFRETFSSLCSGGSQVVCVIIGASFSSCFQNAVMAAADLPHVRVVDSQSLSSGQGILVLTAARLAEKGLSAEEIAARLAELAPQVDGSFLLDRLDYMRNGGRCSAISALGAGLLRIKPCIQLSGGRMGVGKKYRGDLPQALTQYVRDRMDRHPPFTGGEVFIAHPPCREDAVSAVRETLWASGRFSRVWEAPSGCTVACHCGPNTLGIMFLPPPLGGPGLDC